MQEKLEFEQISKIKEYYKDRLISKKQAEESLIKCGFSEKKAKEEIERIR